MSMNAIKFNNDFIGILPFNYDDKRYAEWLSAHIFEMFGFEHPSEYIDSIPDGRLVSKEPYIRVAGADSIQNFTTVAYSSSEEAPPDAHTILFTYKALDRVSDQELAPFVSDSYINNSIRDGMGSGCMFLVRPTKRNLGDYLEWHALKWGKYDYWFCSDWKEFCT